ncbi:MAG: hypothetical protein GEV13_08650 [Rhodospirillales bacterium]|nr:hypothetical protein [Rhodospirillales bacterium]
MLKFGHEAPHWKTHLDRRPDCREDHRTRTIDPIARFGFTQVPNFILTDGNLSLGAKITYAMFLHYAWRGLEALPICVGRRAKMIGGERFTCPRSRRLLAPLPHSLPGRALIRESPDELPNIQLFSDFWRATNDDDEHYVYAIAL